MKIAIVNDMIPFVYGGAEFLQESLKSKLIEYGHEVELISPVLDWTSHKALMDSILSFRMIDVNRADRVIAMTFPAYFVKHHNMKVWLGHQYRQAYDLHETVYASFSDDDDEKRRARQMIIDMDNEVLGALEGNIFTIFHTVSDRLMKYNGIPSEVLISPLISEERYHTSNIFEDFIFYPSRVNDIKRQYMAVEAMRYTKSDVKLILAGKGDHESDEKKIHDLILKYNLENKVTYLNRFISEEEKINLYERCLAAMYIPYDEDSCGYVTMEAFHTGKPVISCVDSGGTDVLVINNSTGYMTKPVPKAIAIAMDEMYLKKDKTIKMGENAHEKIFSLGNTWEYTIRRLTE